MRSLIATILVAAAGISIANAAPVTYGVNFTVTRGVAPDAGMFTYDATTHLFSNFTVNWSGLVFDLTSGANAATITGTPTCLNGLTGPAATFALLDGTCSTTWTWLVPPTPPLDCTGDTVSFSDGYITLEGFNFDAWSQVFNEGGFTITANPKVGVFRPTGSMATQREKHTATLLPNGRVLIAGGKDTSGALTSAELYHPKKETFSATGSAVTARTAHTATLLPNGKVLVVGGENQSGKLMSAELYDPTSGTFSATGSMTVARYDHTATLLPDGEVLIAGGYSSSEAVASAELYNPNTGTFTATGSMTSPRAVHAATLLPGGRVLITGGYDADPYPNMLQSAELYDPKTGTFATTGSMDVYRAGHTATLLNDGEVLLSGGYGYIPDKATFDLTTLASAELYDPKAKSFTPAGAMNAPRVNHTATLLADGKVLVAGGTGKNQQIPAQLYEAKYGTFSDTGLMTTLRQFHTATLLLNGKVLIVGGTNDSHALKSAELFEGPMGGPY